MATWSIVVAIFTANPPDRPGHYMGAPDGVIECLRCERRCATGRWRERPVRAARPERLRQRRPGDRGRPALDAERPIDPVPPRRAVRLARGLPGRPPPPVGRPVPADRPAPQR